MSTPKQSDFDRLSISGTALEGVEVDDIEVIKAGRFLLLRWSGMELQEVAGVFGVDRQTLYRWRKEWETSGRLAQAGRLLLSIHADSIQAKYAEVVEQWPAVVNVLMKLALGAKSEFVRLKAIESLHGMIVLPTMDETEIPGHDEMQHARGRWEEDPTVLPSQAGKTSSSEPKTSDPAESE